MTDQPQLAWVHLNRRGSGRPDAVLPVEVPEGATIEEAAVAALRAMLDYVERDDGPRLCALCKQPLVDGAPTESWAENPVHVECHDAELAAIEADYPDDWGDDNDDQEAEPEDLADPSCVECGGQGGWCGDFTKDGQCIWVWCWCMGEDEDE
jgi:hypothetical protein